MPHIKSIRLVNVHFNNATQFYDDFKMELGGKNTAYDLDNGGGKSLLLLMILQTVLPKSYLRREKPLSLLFQGGKERTSHAAVEWILDEGSVYKYLLTGFSARKRKGSSEAAETEVSEEEQNLQGADIEHLNWCVFYNDNKITGIKAVPFVAEENGRKIYAGFEDIRKYIHQMRQKGLPAEVFDRIDKYQSFLAAHNLIAAEWKIIKGINSGENNIESYFRQDNTSRKLIENQFVKIIEDVEALNKGGKSNEESLLLADTLIEIRSRLNEYLRLKGHLAEFEKIKEYYSEFKGRNDRLFAAFEELEAFKQQAAAIRNLIGKRLEILEKEKTAAIEKREYNTAKHSEGLQRKKLLEAGLINHEKRRLLLKKEELAAEKDRYADLQARLEKELNHLMTLEAYGEYRVVKENLHKIRKRLRALAEDGDALKADYRAAGGRLRFLTERLIEELTLSQEKYAETRNELGKEKEKIQQALIREERKASVLEAAVERLTEKETALGKKLSDLHNYFLGKGEMEAILAPEQFLNQREDDLNRYLSETDSAAGQIQALSARIPSLDLEVAGIEGDIKRCLETKKQYESRLKAYQDELSVLEQKAAGFGQSTLFEYKEALELLIYRENLNKLEKEIEAGRMRQKKQLSEERGYYVPHEKVLALAELLSAKCEFVKTGIEWIAELEQGEKETLVRKMPYLPFAVIVDRISFAKLQRGRLKIDFSSDYPVPVINLEALRLRKNIAEEEIFYFCSFADLLIDGGSFEQYLESIDAALKTIDREVSAAAARITELNGDLFRVTAFFANYPQDQVEEDKRKVEAVEKEILALKSRQQEINEEKSRLLQERDSLNKKIEELSEFAAQCKETIARLAENMQTGKDLAEIREQLSRERGELEEALKSIANIKDAADKLEQQYNSVEERSKQLMLELHDLTKEKELLSGFDEIENNLPITAVRAEFEALNEAVSGRMAEESELRSRLGEYEERLGALKSRIRRDYGGDLEELEKREESGTLIMIPSQSMIEKVKADKEENAAKLAAAGEKVAKVNLKIEKAEGKLEEILKDFPEEIKADLPYYDSVTRFKQEIESVEQLILSYDEGIKRANDELERIKEESSRLSNQAEDYDAFMAREEVVNDGTIAPEIKDFRQFEKEYHRLQAIIEEQCAAWDDRIKGIHAETTDFIIREPLEELGKISRPTGAGQCRARKDAFAEYLASIEEQMQKIGNDLMQLEKYQQDFTRRCVQRAELVLGHLKKLEQLSRIEVYGRRINMIELKLRDFEEKEKYLRMKAHIDGIVRMMSEEGVVDRKRVAARLSTKELLAQITDMDKATVRLYKIESIPENSRFYRWENAIGSEGQNNSLYFIFAACLISFIRMLSITNTSVKTKKVIIADNPFGSTSAVYLWDPMFKIMEQNDIQLIAPGHRIPREIISRFGVSYLLNQDILQDGRMRVVVKDVRVEEDEDVFKYIEPGQLSLF